jgi:hypothetical protein
VEEVALDSPSGAPQRNGAVVLRMAEEFVSVNERAVEVAVSLSVDGKRRQETEFRLTGRMTFPKSYLGEDGEYVSLSDGSVAEATAYIKKIEVDLGHGLSIVTNMLRDKKYYGTAKAEYGDNAVIEDYPQIEAVFTLHTINLKSAVDNVHILWDYEAWVYGADGAYVGTTQDALPYSDAYYVCNERLEALNITQY